VILAYRAVRVSKCGRRGGLCNTKKLLSSVAILGVPKVVSSIEGASKRVGIRSMRINEIYAGFVLRVARVAWICFGFEGRVGLGLPGAKPTGPLGSPPPTTGSSFARPATNNMPTDDDTY
jgi:hypothetical protein